MFIYTYTNKRLKSKYKYAVIHIIYGMTSWDYIIQRSFDRLNVIICVVTLTIC